MAVYNVKVQPAHVREQQRTELDYEWINECIAIKELREGGKSVKDLMGTRWAG